jgi:hypothetical protein
MSSPSQPAASTRSLVVRLHPETEARIAQRMAVMVIRYLSRTQQSGAPKRQEYLTASEVSKTYRVHRGWVYEHAHELGAIRIGDGERPRLRFDPEQVARRLAAGQLAHDRALAKVRVDPKNTTD